MVHQHGICTGYSCFEKLPSVGVFRIFGAQVLGVRIYDFCFKLNGFRIAGSEIRTVEDLCKD